MKISGLALACLTLAGCSVIASSSEFEVPFDAGPGVDAIDGQDAQLDTSVDAPGTDAFDAGPVVEVDCMDDTDCEAVNANATCRFDNVCVLDCAEGFADCDMAFGNGCEVDITTNSDNCGRCGGVCDFEQAEEMCVDGTCEFRGCQDGWGDCNDNVMFDGCEIRLNTAAACGTCDTLCLSPTSLCDEQDGDYVCAANCEDGEIECAGGCVDTDSDPMNCGMCGAEDCAVYPRSSATCDMAACGYACDEGRGDCNMMTADGCEVDVMTSTTHCGMCGNSCSGQGALWACNEGTCEVAQCSPIDQFSDCDGDVANGCEIDILNDPMNCGGCGVICDSTCANGICNPVTEVTGQDEHICARREDGTMVCWGTNGSGQLGDGTFTARPRPTTVINPEIVATTPLLVRDISTGQRNTCAVDVDGEIWCWGSSAGGATGLPEIPTARPRRLTGDAAFTARTFTEIAGGQRSNCAVDDQQHVWCWGSNSGSQLGIGDADSTVPEPARVVGSDLSPLSETVAQLVYGSNHGCARMSAGGVRCWGRNDRGQAGTGATGATDSAEDVGLMDIVDIAAGDEHTCAVNAAGAMWCWGVNDSGQFGNGTTTGSLAPVMVDIGVVSEVSAGFEHTCASVDGEPRCWGRGTDGELGTGTLVGSNVPVTPLSVMPSAALYAVHNYTCAVDSLGLSCWGSNARGQLSRERTIVRTAPTQVSGLTSMTTAISVEETHGCAASGGDVYCWGQDPGDLGRLGGAPAGASPTSVHVGERVHATTNGTSLVAGTGALAFGFNTGGRIAVGSGARPTATTMTFAGAVQDVGMGTAFSCALQGTAVNCRGLDNSGQLGRGTIGGGVSDGPAQPVTGLAASQLSVGPSFACATRTNNRAFCWGDNASGQLGNTGPADSATPIAIAPLTNAIMVSAGSRHACGIQRATGGATSGQVWCWGRNAEYQTGGASPGMNVAPNMVTGLDDAVSVAAYTTHSCAIRASGQVVCWGTNANYQLGDGTTTSSATPVNVVGLTDASALGTGGIGSSATCAVRTSGSAVCWGGCWDGVCGTGEALARPTAAPVQGL